MTRFIQQSACEGRRPHGVVPDRLRSRPRLLSRLLEDRGALRLVVAPPGFGKATLAFEYASVMFQFEHVFWLRGSSPCFLRDLDAGVLAEAVLEADEHAALMVVADLPLLTDDRAEAFAEVVERLADASCEVIATTTRADAPMELFGRRVVIEAAEMLVAREDLEEEPEGVTDRRPLGLAERIAALRWGSATPIQLVLGASRAGCTPEEELALWAMTVLGRGTIDDVRALLGARRAEKAWDALAARCPLVGISAGEESFAALSVSLGEVRDHGRARLQALAETCGFAGREEAMEVLAERLMERGECGRAVSAMTLLARRRAHGRWLAANGWAALWGGAAVEVCELYESATRTQMAARADINAMIAWAWAQRGDRARAVQFAQRSLVSERSTPRTVLSAALAAWEVGNAATRRAMEETVASCLAELDGAGGVEREDGLAELVVVAHGVLALGRGDDVLAVWASRVGEALDWGSGSRIDVERRLLGAAAALEGLEATGALGAGADTAIAGRPELVRLVACSHRALDALVERGWSLGFGAYRAAAALERAGEDRARLEGIVAVETAARAEAEAQLEEAASARDEALARLGSLERDAASFAKGAAETEAEEARAALERSEARRAKAEQDLVSASSESEQAARALSMLQDKVSALTDELYTARSKTEAAERRVRQLDNGMSELISNISDERDLYANVLKERERLAGLLDDAGSELSRRSSLADRLSEELQAAEKRAAQAENAAKEAALDSESLAKDLEHARARSSELETALAAAKAKAGTAEDAEERLRAALAELADVKAKRLEDAAAWQADLQRIDAQLKASRGNVVQTGSGEVVVRHVYPDAPKPTMAARAQSVAYTVGRGAVALVVVAALSLLASAILTAASNGASFGEGLRTVLGTVLDVIP